jgi:hypothetical protein
MSSRRDFLLTLGGTAVVTGLAGCSDFFSESTDGQQPNIFPPAGLETDEELLTSVADPSLQVPPRFFSGYEYRLPELDGVEAIPEIVPRLGGDFLGVLKSDIRGVDVEDCNRVVGSSYYALWSTGPIGNPIPSGQTIHVTGEFSKDSFVDWLDSVEGYRRLGADGSGEQYIADIVNGRGFETWAIQHGRVIIVSRTDVTSRSSRYDTNREAATEALKLEFDQVERDDAPIANTAPEFVKTVQALDDGAIRAGTAYATIPLGSSTGTDAFDSVVSGVVGGGVSADVDGRVPVQRTVSYLEGLADADTLRAAYSAADAEASEDWSLSVEADIAHARTNMDAVPGPTELRTVLPVPGYTNFAQRITPSDLNRTPNPRVLFDGESSDGGVTITHTGGDDVEDLRVRYVQNGGVEYESWSSSGAVSQGDSFRSDGAPDSGTQVWLTWRPDTRDAAVLYRLHVE